MSEFEENMLKSSGRVEKEVLESAGLRVKWDIGCQSLKKIECLVAQALRK